jgi:hypothetical protein
MGHSAEDRISLTIDDHVFNVGSLGPDHIRIRNPVDRPSADGEMMLSIDGNVERWRVWLPDGISAGATETRIARPREDGPVTDSHAESECRSDE